MGEWLQTISRMSEGRATRSTALQPVLWMLGLLLAAFVGSASYGAVPWVQILLGSMTGLVFVFGLAMYAMFATRNPDLLRSEKYAIRKMEIEQAAMGDSLLGVLDAADTKAPNLPQGPSESGS